VAQTNPELAAVVETLVEHGATYVAANTWSLVDEPAQLYYHLPAGVSDSRKKSLATYLDEEVGHRPYERQVGTIRIGGQATPARVHFVHRNSLHLYRRTPVYIADGVAGLNPVEIEDGVDNAREVVCNRAGHLTAAERDGSARTRGRKAGRHRVPRRSRCTTNLS